MALSSTFAIAQGAKTTTENRALKDTERDDPAERARWFMRGRMVNGKPAPELLHRAYRQKLNNRAQNRAKESAARTSTTVSTTGTNSAVPASSQAVLSFTPTTSGPAWQPLGPSPSGSASVGDLDQDYGPVIGRSTVVLVDQNDPNGNTVYLGGAAGGLWKSTNAADPLVQNCNSVSLSQAPFCAPNVVWRPLIDQQASLTVGAMAIRPGNNQWLVVGTGEANNSSDSYYGLGFLISQDGGTTWTSVSTATGASGSGSIDLHGLGTTQIAFSTDNPSLVVASMAAASGGIAVGAELAGGTARGIYFSNNAGLTWQRATMHDNGSTPDAGSSNTVIYNPFTHTFFADVRWHGLYTSADGKDWTRLPNTLGTLNLDSNCPSAVPTSGNVCPLYRSVLTMVPNRAGSQNKGEMYIFVVDANDVNKGIYRSVDGAQTWTTFDVSGINRNDDTSGGTGTNQGTYNLTLAAVPNGTVATDIYAGAVNQYRCNYDPASNPTCASPSFANLTHVYGNCGGALNFGGFAHVHPDQHGIDFSVTKPQIIYFANDGGVYRTLNGFDTTQKSCGTLQPWIQYDNLSGTMGSMIQFVWFSQHPSDATVALGGTQDNGSMARNSASLPNAYGASWQSVNNGDGGFTDINATNPNEWFYSNPHVDISQCVNTGGGITCSADGATQIISSSTLGSDGSTFYPPFRLDPQAAGHMLVGTCRLWRVERPGSNTGTWSNATALTYNLDNFTFAGTSSCASSANNNISAIAAGGPCKGVCNSGTNGTGNGSQVIYVGTEAGKIFVTTNADGGVTTWSDRSSGLNNTTGCGGTGCVVSGIAIDPSDASGLTAYATVMGFNTGHVFKTTNAGQSWTNLDGSVSGTGLPDNPADGVAIDPNVPNLIYVATDVGVFQSMGDGNWQEVGKTGDPTLPLSDAANQGLLPNVAATAVKVFGTGAATRLRVSTYGRGLWDIPIPNVPNFQFVVNQTSQTAGVNQTATFTGSITPYNRFSSAVNVSCVASGATQHVPQTCTVNPSTLSSGTFSVMVSDPAAGDFTFNIVGVGQDASATTNQVTVTFHSILTTRYTLSQPPNASAAQGLTATTSFNLVADSTYNGSVTLACDGLPAGATCSFSPATALSAGQTIHVTASIATGTAAIGSYPITIKASSSDALTQTVSLTLGVTVPPDFTLGTVDFGNTVYAAGDPAQTTFSISTNSTYPANSPITFSCTAAAFPPSACTFTPASIANPGSNNSAIPMVGLSVDTTGLAASDYTVVVNADGAGIHKMQTATIHVNTTTTTWNITTMSAIAPAVVKSGQQLSAMVSINSPGSFAGAVNLSCAFENSASPVGTSRCSMNPPSATFPGGGPVPATVTVDTTGAPAGNPRLVVVATDGTKSANVEFGYAVTDFSVSAATPAAFTVGNSSTAAVTLTGQNNYQGTVGVQCSAPGLTCTLNAPTVQLTSAAPTAMLTATLAGPAATDANAGGTIPITITASDSGFASLTHGVAANATLQNYNIAASPSAATVVAGGSATFALNASALGGYAGAVAFNATTLCSGLPSLTTCSVDKTTLNGSGTVMVTIKTTATTTSAVRPLRLQPGPLFAYWSMLPGAFGIVLLSGVSRRRRLWMLLGLALVLMVTMTACGGGGGGSTTSPPPTVHPGTPAGTSTVTLTTTSTSGAATLSRTTSFTLTVQ